MPTLEVKAAQESEHSAQNILCLFRAEREVCLGGTKQPCKFQSRICNLTCRGGCLSPQLGQWAAVLQPDPHLADTCSCELSSRKCGMTLSISKLWAVVDICRKCRNSSAVGLFCNLNAWEWGLCAQRMLLRCMRCYLYQTCRSGYNSAAGVFPLAVVSDYSDN